MKGAKAPTASTWPAAKAAAARHRWEGLQIDVGRPHPRPLQAEEQQVVVDGALLDRDLLAPQVGDAR